MSTETLGMLMLCGLCLIPFLLGVVITNAWHKGKLVPGWVRNLFDRIKYGE